MLEDIPKSARYTPLPQECPHCFKPKPCRDERCMSQYPDYKDDDLPSDYNPAVPPAPKDYAEHLYMHGDEDVPQIGSPACRHYFAPADYDKSANDD